MRVLFIAGYQHAAYHRKIELLADAPDVELLHITVTGYGRESGMYSSASGKGSYRVKTFRPQWLGARSDPHRSFLWTLDFAMRAFKPDLVQAESDLEALGTAQVSLARKWFAPQSKLIHYSWQNISRPRNFLVRWLTNLSLQSADHITCASAQAAEILPVQNYRRATSVMPLVGVDSRFFKPATKPRASEFSVGYVGRLVREKGLDDLLHAVARTPASLLIVGDGPEKNNLRALAQALPLSERCRFVDAVAYEAVADYLNEMDVLVLPSRTTSHWKEQFGRVLVEAMGCRVVAVGSDSGAIPEVIGDAGAIFPESDVDALAAILNRLAANPEMLESMRERGYRRALENYSVERLAERTLDIWRELMRCA